ncbi:MAG TPA: hypothetical protein VGJ66_02690, partial [Pyrinomonadaceae bacterium]
IEKRVGWHKFSQTYSTMLVANGENVKVIQELMRHASSVPPLKFILRPVLRTSGPLNNAWYK